MFRSLYARLLVLFLAVLMTAMSLLSVLLYQRIRSDKINARLDELLMQARDIAFLAAQRSDSVTGETDRYLMWKSQEIMRDFDAYIIIIDSNGQIIPIGDETMEFSYDFTVEETVALLKYVVAGVEIRDRTVLETGNPVFTVGVPYVQDGRVLGAVFIHTSEQSIESSYKEILSGSLRAMLMAMTLGAFLILVVAQLITRPLREMAVAADRYAHGDFKKRIKVDSHDEIGHLAEALNSMAGDLDRLEQTRRAFVANVSHELRSPLTSMQGFINGILDGTVPEGEQEHYLGIVLDETRRLNKLISTLLDLSHMDSGQAELNRIVFDINEMAYRVLFRNEARINEKGMDVEIAFQSEQCYVNADADSIEQVLVNLIDNAIKYGQEGGKLILLTKRNNGTTTISVSDDGGGIPEEDIPFIFERFYKVDKAHTTGKGTGLGLAICKTIIDQHGQVIGVESAPGKGTTFTFTLESAKAPAAPAITS